MGVFAEGITGAQEISAARAGLERATGTQGVLAASWDAFEVLQALAGARADPRSPAYPAYMTAAAAAAEARDWVGWAPSMTSENRAPGDSPNRGTGGGSGTTAMLASLAELLTGRLDAAAREAALSGDREALEQASLLAGDISTMLAEDRQ